MSDCVLESSKILLSNGHMCLARDIIVGNSVMTPQGSSKVRLIIETTLTEPTEIVQIGNLFITPTHPIYVNGRWILPKNHHQCKILWITDCKVYSFALEFDHVMIINDIKVICLGHGFNDPVVKHPYLSSQRIVEDLYCQKDFDGKVRFSSSDFLTQNTGQVSINPQFFIRKKIEADNQEIPLNILLESYALY